MRPLREKHMPLGQLTGHAIAMAGLGADHTYVTSSTGSACACFGRRAGGVVVCSGLGNVDQADCLATPSGNGGVLYGITGVCHQEANRILWPAGVTVMSARGARGSLVVWGLYGRDPATLKAYSPASHPWSELANCQQNHAHP
jgi:hypothetical protein